MVCSKHTSDFTCTLASNCTWYNKKCYDMPECKGDIMPSRMPISWPLLCSNQKTFPISPGYAHPPSWLPKTPDCLGSMTTPHMPPQDDGAHDLIINKFGITVPYDPQMCHDYLTNNPTRYNNIQHACSPPGTSPAPSPAAKQYADEAIAYNCAYLSTDQAEQRGAKLCDKFFQENVASNDNICIVGKDGSERENGGTTGKNGWWPIQNPYKPGQPERHWYTVLCKEGITCNN